MSTNAPQWFSEMMTTKITQARQARGKRLAGTTRRGDVKEKKVIFPIGGRGEAYKLTGAIQKVKPMNADRKKVSVDMEDFETSEWINTPDLEKMGPNELQQTAQELAFAINRREDQIQWDATSAFAADPGVIKVGSNLKVADPLILNATKAKLRGTGDNGAYDIFCPVPEMVMEQLKLWKQFSRSDWVGDRDLPMLNMRDMAPKHYNGVIYFTLPDEYFKNAAGDDIGDGGATDFFTYMWASDALGVETNWDKQQPSFTQHKDYEGSPWLGKVGMGGAAVGILPKGMARIQLKTLTDLVDPHP